jgi:ectoine hydroxylase-related dioxygenase (phytanoyl-CoA dioxygenase family)
MSLPLPPLDGIYPITESMHREYQQRGYVLLRDVCTPRELAPYAEAIRDTAIAQSQHYLPLEQRDTYGKAFLQIVNLWKMDPVVAQFVAAKRFGQIAADLMGVRGVRLYHDQALFKEAGGGPTPWHQDQFYWPLDGVKTVTMWMPLVHVTADMMAMKFVPGTHAGGPISMTAISDASDKFFNDYIHGRGMTMHQIQEMSPGDATFHDGWTLHGAPGNATDRMREVMTIIFFEDGARVSEPDSDFRRNDQAAFFPGTQPGDLAATEMNPLVYSR